MSDRSMISIELADEDRKDTLKEERAIFVDNLGILLSQTRKGIVGCKLKGTDIVVVTFVDGHTKEVQIDSGSFLSIIRDVIINISY